MTKSHVMLRMQRLGVRNNPAFRIVAANKRAPRDGKFIEILGSYNPRPDPSTGLKTLQIKSERALFWISVGAEPSDRVAWLLAKSGILPEKPFPVNKTKSTHPKQKEAERREALKARLEEKAREEEEAREKAQQEADEQRAQATGAQEQGETNAQDQGGVESGQQAAQPEEKRAEDKDSN